MIDTKQIDGLDVLLTSNNTEITDNRTDIDSALNADYTSYVNSKM